MSALPQTTGYLSIGNGHKKPGALSIVAGSEKPGALSIGNLFKKPGALSTGGDGEKPGALSIDKIEARRRKAGISMTALLGEARVNERTFRRSRRDKGAFRDSTLERLDRALDRLVVGERSSGNLAAIKQLYLLAIGVVAERCEVDVEAAHAMATDFRHENPNNPAWLNCARVRRLAMYLIANAMQFGNAALANAIGCSRQNVKQAVKSIEQLREAEPALDALIAKVAALAGRS
jgi:hypothetical protein